MHFLLYFVNKPYTTRRVIRWLLLLHKMVRKRKQHYIIDHLLRIRNGEIPIGVNDELLDATLFKAGFLLECYNGAVEYLMSGRPPPE